jgi:antitoxin YefM
VPRALDHGLTPEEQYSKTYACQQGLKPMDAISYSTARAHLAGTMNKVCENHEPVVITRRGEPAVVMLSLADYKAMEETTFLLRSPANAQRLLRSIACLNSGGGEEHDLLPCD